MAEAQRKRTDPRRETTRVALIEAAESLFAELGVDAVSTRMIGAAIGSLNTNVVAYHFGSKEALVDAVYRHRLPAIDRRRGDLLREAAARGGEGDLASLMRAFALPLFEQRDAAGRHSYARFLGAIERAGLMARRALLSAEFPESERVLAAMARCLPGLSTPEFNARMRLAAGLLVAALQVIDTEGPADPALARQSFETAMAMAAAALSVPSPEYPA